METRLPHAPLSSSIAYNGTYLNRLHNFLYRFQVHTKNIYYNKWINTHTVLLQLLISSPLAAYQFLNNANCVSALTLCTYIIDELLPQHFQASRWNIVQSRTMHGTLDTNVCGKPRIMPKQQTKLGYFASRITIGMTEHASVYHGK